MKAILLFFAIVIKCNDKIIERLMVIVPGLGMTCSDFGYLKKKKLKIKCLDLSIGFFRLNTIEEITPSGCINLNKLLAKEKNKNKDTQNFELYLIGFSQGGMIARNIIHTCHNIRPIIKGLVTFGTPNLGIDSAPKELNPQESKHIVKYIKKKIISKFKKIQKSEDMISNYGFVDYINKFIEFTPDANFDDSKAIPINHLYSDYNFAPNDYYGYDTIFKSKDKKYYIKKPTKLIKKFMEEENIYSNLDFSIHIALGKDEMVLPVRSQIFGAKYETKNKNIEYRFEEAHLAYLKTSGLKDLYESNRMALCLIDHEHFIYNSEVIKLDKLLNRENCDGLLKTEKNDTQNAYMSCIYKKIKLGFVNGFNCKFKNKEILQTTEDIKGNEGDVIRNKKNEFLGYSLSLKDSNLQII